MNQHIIDIVDIGIALLPIFIMAPVVIAILWALLTEERWK